MPKFRFIRCKIERGGFASERTFEIPVSGGEPLIAMTDVKYLCDLDYKPIPDGEPPHGSSIEGLIKCRILRESVAGETLVEVPSADVINVRTDELVETN